MTPRLQIRPEVAAALEAGRAVVALESTVISHGLPPPHNLEIAQRLEAVIRERRATPATIAILVVAFMASPALAQELVR